LENARVATGLHHPSLVTVLGHGREIGRPYVVFELVEGVDLAKRVSRDGALRPRLAIEHTIAVARALEAAAQRGLTHGDVRPRHMLETASGIVKLVGLGLSPRTKTAHGR